MKDLLTSAELNAIRRFADLHTGGCQSPHGGKCSCGWNLIEARIEELEGEPAERVAFLRSTVRDLQPDEQETVNDILAGIEADMTH